MGIMKTIEKALFKLIVGLLGFITVAFIVMTICWGPFGSGVDNTIQATIPTVTSTPEPTPEPTQDPDVKDRITTRFDGQEIHVKCKILIIPTDSGTIFIENDDIEVISVIGSGNMIAYPSTANPEIRDVGSYNEIWGSIWL